MVSLTKFRGLAFIAIWQTAPIVAHEDSAGNLVIHFAGGVGRYETVMTNCDGQVLDTQDHPYRTGAVAVEAWPAEKAHVTAFAGANGVGDRWTANGGALVAIELQSVGFGGGVTGFTRIFEDDPAASLDESTSEPMPLVYLRAGDVDGHHLRFESASLTGLDRFGGFMRTGWAYNQGQLRGSRFFAGIGMCNGDCGGGEGETAVGFIDLTRRLGPKVDLRFGALYGPGQRNPEYGVTLGITWLPNATAAPTALSD